MKMFPKGGHSEVTKHTLFLDLSSICIEKVPFPAYLDSLELTAMFSLISRTSIKALPKRNVSFFKNFLKFSPDEYIHLYGEKADPDVPVFKIMKAFGDKEYGGASSGTVNVVSEGAESFVRWTGVKDFGGEHAMKTKARGGFVAVKLFCAKPVDVMDLDGFLIEMRVREDHHLSINMRCTRSMDLITTHQTNVLLKGGSEWQKFFVPFDKFTATHNGVEKAEDQENDSLQLASFGFLMNSSTWVPGEFQVDLKNLTVTKAEKLPELTGGKIPFHK